MKHTRVWMALFTIFFTILAMVHSGSAADLSDYVCPMGKIAIGNPISDFSFRCSEATQIAANNNEAMWVLLDPAARQIVYFQFASSQLERIYTKPCLTSSDAQEDPYCAQLQGLENN